MPAAAGPASARDDPRRPPAPLAAAPWWADRDRSALQPSRCAARRRAPPRCIRPPWPDPAGRDRASSSSASRSPSRECSCAAAASPRARRDWCCRCRRTASRTRLAGSIPSAAAGSDSSTRACACRRSSTVRCRRPHSPAHPSTARATPPACRWRNAWPTAGPSTRRR